MLYRTFGRTGWQVSEVGYGMWGMAGWTGSESEEVNRALDRSVNWAVTFLILPGVTERDLANKF